MQDPAVKPARKRKWKRLVYVGLVILFVSVFRSTVADWNDVLSSSMEPTIIPGDRLLVNKTAFDVRFPFTDYVLLNIARPERGDIIVFIEPQDRIRMIKRVVGLPGDVLSLRRGMLSINGKLAEYQPADHVAFSAPIQFGMRSFVAAERIPGHFHAILRTPLAPGPSIIRYTVPPEHVYVLGDNRDNSEDSRFYGSVPFENIIGRVQRVVISLDHEDRFDLREGRTWMELQ